MKFCLIHTRSSEAPTLALMRSGREGAESWCALVTTALLIATVIRSL